MFHSGNYHCDIYMVVEVFIMLFFFLFFRVTKERML